MPISSAAALSAGALGVAAIVGLDGFWALVGLLHLAEAVLIVCIVVWACRRWRSLIERVVALAYCLTCVGLTLYAELIPPDRTEPFWALVYLTAPIMAPLLSLLPATALAVILYTLRWLTRRLPRRPSAKPPAERQRRRLPRD